MLVHQLFCIIMDANLRNFNDFEYICTQKNNMNGIYILLTILLYFGILLLVARLTGRHSDNDAFFRGNRRSPWYIVSFGMIGASLSGVTFVSVPGMVRGIDMTYMQTCFGFFIGYLIIAHVLLPLYYRLNLTSIYTYLGDRIGRHAYKTGASFSFCPRSSEPQHAFIWYALSSSIMYSTPFIFLSPPR